MSNFLKTKTKKHRSINLNLVVWMCFMLFFIQFSVDFILITELSKQLLIVKLTSFLLLVLIVQLLANKRIKSTLILHLILFLLNVTSVFSLTLVDGIGIHIYMIYLTVFFVAINLIAIWSFWDGIFQFLLLGLIFFLFDFFDFIDYHLLIDEGFYISLSICALSVIYPSIKQNLLEDRFHQSLVNDEYVKKINNELENLETSKAEQDKLFNHIYNQLKVVQHDFSNKINNINSLSDLIEMENQYSVAEGQDNYLNLIRYSVDELSALNNQLLDPFDKSQEENLRPNFIQVDIRELLKNNLTKNRVLIEAKNIQTNLALTEEDFYLWTDKNLLAISIFNIVKYSLRLSSNNDTLDISMHKSNNQLQLQFVNKNTGVNMSKLNTYFKHIDQYNITEANNKQGFGLSIAKYYIEKLGGHLIYSSSTSLGFEFSIEFNTQ